MSLPENLTEDRRRPEGVLLAVMKHVDERIAEVESRHNDRFSRIESKITNLADSVNCWMDKEPAAILERVEVLIDESIPTSPDNPDATPKEKRKEHRTAHAKWIKNVVSEVEKWQRIRANLLEWALKGAIGVIVVAVWAYVLKGP